MKITDLSGYNTLIDIEVYWGDMDAANHVNNVNYLKWTEAARINYFMKAGISTEFNGSSIAPILSWQDCKYISPMTFPDIAQIGIRVTELKKDRIVMEAAVFSKKQKRISALSKQEFIPYDYENLQKSTIPIDWIKEIEKIEKTTFG